MGCLQTQTHCVSPKTHKLQPGAGKQRARRTQQATSLQGKIQTEKSIWYQHIEAPWQERAARDPATERCRQQFQSPGSSHQPPPLLPSLLQRSQSAQFQLRTGRLARGAAALSLRHPPCTARFCPRLHPRPKPPVRLSGGAELTPRFTPVLEGSTKGFAQGCGSRDAGAGMPGCGSGDVGSRDVGRTEGLYCHQLQNSVAPLGRNDKQSHHTLSNGSGSCSHPLKMLHLWKISAFLCHI